MKLKQCLLQKQSTVLETWFDLIVESYPADSHGFFKDRKDRFANPVAYEFRQGMKGLYEALIHGMERDAVVSCIDRIISIRAIQDPLPSKVIAFIFLLKTVIRTHLEAEIRETLFSEELREFESQIDGLALLCFDVYMKRREQLYEIRVHEVKNRVSGLMRKAGLIAELEEEPKPSNKDTSIV
jgi:hypothetical protein